MTEVERGGSTPLGRHRAGDPVQQPPTIGEDGDLDDDIADADTPSGDFAIVREGASGPDRSRPICRWITSFPATPSATAIMSLRWVYVHMNRGVRPSQRPTPTCLRERIDGITGFLTTSRSCCSLAA